MAFEVDAQIVDTVTATLSVLHRKLARPDELIVREGARSGLKGCTTLVERWDRQDGRKTYQPYLPDGRRVTRLEEVAALMGVSEKVAAAYVLEEETSDMSIHHEAKAFYPPPDDDSNGIAVMFAVGDDDAKQLALQGGTPWNALHITAGYFGKVGDDGAPQEDDFLYTLRHMAKKYGPFTVNLNGLARFSLPDSDAIVVLADSPVLEDFRRDLIEICDDEELPLQRKHAYVAHMTLGLADHDEDIPLSRWVPREVNITSVMLGYGTQYTHVDLGTGEVKDVFTSAVGPTSNLSRRSFIVDRVTGRVRELRKRRRAKKPEGGK